MHDIDVAQMLGVLAVMLWAAQLFGWLAKLIRHPAVLGELVAGVLLGGSVLGIVDSHDKLLDFLAELGVVILLFRIGLETNLRKLFKAGGVSATVALAGVAVPFALGYATCRTLGLDNLVAIVAGASLTATSVGITARILSDLGHLQEPESQIILGAAVIDDVVGLVILTVVAGMAAGDKATVGGVATIAAVAVGFLIVTLLVGMYLLPWFQWWARRIDLPGTPTIGALIIALGLAWAADVAGSAMIVGAFAAGVLLARSPYAHEIERGVASIGHFFVPLFFVVVGSAVELGGLNPLDPANHRTLLVAGALIVVAMVSKFAAGYAPFWYKGRKSVIGVGMIPRGEVGLIFAQMGLSTGLLDSGLFSAVTLMVMATTFAAPPLLYYLMPPSPSHKKPRDAEEIDEW